MSSLFCFLLPSVFGVKFLSILTKKDGIKDLVLYYLLLVLFSNIMCAFAVIILNNYEENLVTYINQNLKFGIKYCTLSIVINLVISFVFSIFIKYFKINLEVKREKNNKKIN